MNRMTRRQTWWKARTDIRTAESQLPAATAPVRAQKGVGHATDSDQFAVVGRRADAVRAHCGHAAASSKQLKDRVDTLQRNREVRRAAESVVAGLQPMLLMGGIVALAAIGFLEYLIGQHVMRLLFFDESSRIGTFAAVCFAILLFVMAKPPGDAIYVLRYGKERPVYSLYGDRSPTGDAEHDGSDPRAEARSSGTANVTAIGPRTDARLAMPTPGPLPTEPASDDRKFTDSEKRTLWFGAATAAIHLSFAAGALASTGAEPRRYAITGWVLVIAMFVNAWRPTAAAWVMLWAAAKLVPVRIDVFVQSRRTKRAIFAAVRATETLIVGWARSREAGRAGTGTLGEQGLGNRLSVDQADEDLAVLDALGLLDNIELLDTAITKYAESGHAGGNAPILKRRLSVLRRRAA